jgi:hypothetical protein
MYKFKFQVLATSFFEILPLFWQTLHWISPWKCLNIGKISTYDTAEIQKLLSYTIQHLVMISAWTCPNFSFNEIWYPVPTPVYLYDVVLNWRVPLASYTAITILYITDTLLLVCFSIITVSISSLMLLVTIKVQAGILHEYFKILVQTFSVSCGRISTLTSWCKGQIPSG